MTNSTYQHYIGVGIASTKLDIYDQTEQTHTTIANTPEAIIDWIGGLKQRAGTVLVVMEASGGCENRLVDALRAAEIAVAVVNPAQIRQFARGLGKLEKTGKVDASIIAFFGQVAQPLQHEARSAAIKQLRDLMRRRDEVLEMIGAEQTRLDKREGRPDAKYVREFINSLTDQLKELDADITQLLESEQLREAAQRLQSVKGVDWVTAATLLAELAEPESPELGRADRSPDCQAGWRSTDCQ